MEINENELFDAFVAWAKKAKESEEHIISVDFKEMTDQEILDYAAESSSYIFELIDEIRENN